jgi:hypothetical protein
MHAEEHMRFHYNSQNITLFKTLLAGVFHLKIVDHGCPQVTDNAKSEVTDTRKVLKFQLFLFSTGSEMLVSLFS